MQQLESMSRLLSLERLQPINCLSKMKQATVNVSAQSYLDVDVKPNSVIYCDIPYRSTSKYNDIEFDYEAF